MVDTTKTRQDLLDLFEKAKQFLPSKQHDEKSAPSSSDRAKAAALGKPEKTDEDIAEILKKPESETKNIILGFIAQIIKKIMALEAILNQPEHKPQPKVQHSHLFDQLEAYTLGVVALDHELDKTLKSVSEDSVDKPLNQNLVRLKELTKELQYLLERLKLIEQTKITINENLKSDSKEFEESYKDACKERPELTRKEFFKENAPELNDKQIGEYLDEMDKVKSQEENENITANQPKEPIPTPEEQSEIDKQEKQTPTPKPTPEQGQTETKEQKEAKERISTSNASTTETNANNQISSAFSAPAGDSASEPAAITPVSKLGAIPITAVPSGGAQPFAGNVRTTVVPTEARITIGSHVAQTIAPEARAATNKPENSLFARLAKNICMLKQITNAMERTVASIDMTKNILKTIEKNPEQPVPTRTPTPAEQPAPEEQPRNAYTPRPAHK